MLGRYIRVPVLASAYGVLVRLQSAVIRVTAVISNAATTGTHGEQHPVERRHLQLDALRRAACAGCCREGLRP